MDGTDFTESTGFEKQRLGQPASFLLQEPHKTTRPSSSGQRARLHPGGILGRTVLPE